MRYQPILLLAAGAVAGVFGAPAPVTGVAPPGSGPVISYFALHKDSGRQPRDSVKRAKGSGCGDAQKVAPRAESELKQASPLEELALIAQGNGAEAFDGYRELADARQALEDLTQ
ncbi:hypothetical protein B0H15DRAFT_953655 [Mycena belliarum]|uniref:Uncharacterized protein n=1 Tax=Mycena belliarum TaxID=1033014 RepID=A0AAD6TWL4_9AGAR|nr:hypothetical protein B0H15DRAFT_953655 [Mycena belliae]